MAQDLSGRTLGEYILREQIGEGGYAVVYRGEQPYLERSVAIKVRNLSTALRHEYTSI